MNLPDFDLTSEILAAAFEVHRELGPGLLESAYQAAMEVELRIRKIEFRSQVPVSIEYKGVAINAVYRLDFMIDDRVVVEIKSCSRIESVHEAQLIT